jgi:ParB family protein of integrating conjugative element (PFGI_1 class)
MAELSAQDLAAKLMADKFTHIGPDASALSDPIVDTPMVVTLEQLRPYDLNPRITRNPLYDEIKASIRERGLDAPPAITRRPLESHFIIRNGGNTRLSILKELWSETREERFFRIACLFRPWSARGEIVALTGHLAENELHGRLSFIERALGVEKVSTLYENEIGKPLSQRELARRLSADGYPVTQSYISRMHDAVRYLLPAIPTLLYAGLGKAQIGQLIALHNAALASWVRHAPKQQDAAEFTALFQEVLARFDAEPATLNLSQVQDELVAQLTATIGVDYFALTLEIDDTEARQRAVNREPATQPAVSTPTLSVPSTEPSSPRQEATQPARQVSEQSAEAKDRPPQRDAQPADTTHEAPAFQHATSDAGSEAVDQSEPEPVSTVVTSAPEARQPSTPENGSIEPALDAPDRLRADIAQLARDIADEAHVAHRVEPIDDGIGFFCVNPVARDNASQPTLFERALVALLNALSAGYTQQVRVTSEGLRLAPGTDALPARTSNRERWPAERCGIGKALSPHPSRTPTAGI